MRVPLLLSLLLALSVVPAWSAEGEAPAPPPPDPWTEWKTPLPQEALDGLDYALSAQLLTRHDLSYKKDWLDDPYRLSLVTAMLDDPLALGDTTWAYGHALEGDDVLDWLGSHEGLEWLSVQLDLPNVVVSNARFNDPATPEPTNVLQVALSNLTLAHEQLWLKVVESEREALAQSAWGLARGEEDEMPAPDGFDSFAKFGLATWDTLRTQPGSHWIYNWSNQSGDAPGEAWPIYLWASLDLLGDVDALAQDLGDMERDERQEALQALQFVESGLTIIHGTMGDDRAIVAPGTVIIDPGGNDTYSFVEGSLAPTPLRHLVIDLAGNDLYTTEGLAGIGGGYLGTAICYDLAGDDVYRSNNVSQGAGMFGFGALVDKGGRDLYDGGDFCQGAGMFGMGLLLDEGPENDAYRATLYAQACALTGGMGLLLERDGDDTYYAGGKHPDFPRWPENTLSLSQGFAIGMRPIASGGIAFLGDYGGNDFYSTEVYGQGVSYWYSLGMLLDRGGWDWYDCLQYGQGTGIHLSAGCLIDTTGTDHYNGWALLQGSGHDLGAGVFIDMAGNDFYNGRDLVQGAGQANGLGLAFDLAGDDTWFSNSDVNQGYGNWRRDFGSIGMLIDVHGKDLYNQPDRGDGLLWTGTTYGACLDMEDPEHPAPVKFIKVPGTTGAQ